MTSPDHDHRRIGVLALLADPKPMNALLDALRLEGVEVDVVDNLHTARSSSFGAGRHDCLIIATAVTPGVAARVAWSLGQLAPDPELPPASPGRSARWRQSWQWQRLVQRCRTDRWCARPSSRRSIRVRAPAKVRCCDSCARSSWRRRTAGPPKRTDSEKNGVANGIRTRDVQNHNLVL